MYRAMQPPPHPYTEQFHHPSNTLSCCPISPARPLANTDLFSTSIVLSFPECRNNRITQYVTFETDFLHLAWRFWDSSMLLYVSVFTFYCILWHRCIMVCLSTHLLNNVWVDLVIMNRAASNICVQFSCE